MTLFCPYEVDTILYKFVDSEFVFTHSCFDGNLVISEVGDGKEVSMKHIQHVDQFNSATVEQKSGKSHRIKFKKYDEISLQTNQAV